MVLVVLAVLAAVAIPKVGMMIDSSSKAATLDEMMQLKRAIVGSPNVTAGGQFIDVGYEGDVGSLPSSLNDLVMKPPAVAQYNPFSRLGWNGPYIDPSNSDYLTDAWGAAYQYDAGARTITSTGSSETIVINF
jgi:hypothetical protein